MAHSGQAWSVIAGVIEACWLISLIIVPVLVNPAGLVYDLPRVALLRALTLVMLGAHFAAQTFRSRRPPNDSEQGQWSGIKIVWPLYVMAASVLLSTLVSISPLDSVWGSFFRQQGAYLSLAYLAWALLIVAYLRTSAQRQRLLAAIILSGTLVALSGIIEPFYWHKNLFVWRAGGLQGNPIFLGAYLIMVMPFTLAGLVAAADRRPPTDDHRPPTTDHRPPTAGQRPKGNNQETRRAWLVGRSLWWMVLGSVALALQMAALALTQSRGPWIGALVGVVLWADLMLWQRHRLAVMSGTLAAVLAMGGLLIGLNMAVVTTPSLSTMPYVGRFNLTQSVQSGTGRVRLVLWQAAGKVVTTWPQVIPEGDPFHGVRPLLGYGPDTASIVYMHVYPPELAHIEDPSALWDRAHNETLDVLTMQGGLGVLAYLVLGIVCARRGWMTWRAATSGAERALSAAPLAALAAHFVEAQFAFTLTSAGMMGWLCVALLLQGAKEKRPAAPEVGGREQGPEYATDDRQNAIRHTPPRLRFVFIAMAIGLLLIALRVEGGLVWADTLAGRARQADRAGDWKNSLAWYDRALALAPWQATYYQFRSESLYNLAQALPEEQGTIRVPLLEAAERGLARARQLLPLDVEILSNSGILHAYWAELDPAHLGLAEAFYRRALALAPTRAQLLMDLGHVYHNHARFADALAQYRAALEIDPQLASAHFDCGLAYLALGQPELARQAFQAALALAPECQECREQLEAIEP